VNVFAILLGGTVGAWGGIFGVLYVRRRAFAFGKWQYVAPVLLMCALLVSGPLALAIQRQDFDSWMNFICFTSISVIILGQNWKKDYMKYDVRVFVTRAADVLGAVHAVLQERNLAFEDSGEVRVTIPALPAEIAIDYNNGPASANLAFTFPPNRHEKQEIVRALKLSLAGHRYEKILGRGVTYLVLTAIWVAFWIILYAIFQ
jgi:hypothetical protein